MKLLAFIFVPLFIAALVYVLARLSGERLTVDDGLFPLLGLLYALAAISLLLME